MLPVLKDARLQKRYSAIVSEMKKAPDRSFPEAMPDEAALLATYRFLNNERIEWRTLLAPELQLTATAMAAHKLCLVAHDSTVFMFGGDGGRSDIGSLDGVHT